MDQRQSQFVQGEWEPISGNNLPENTFCRFTYSQEGQCVGRELQAFVNNVWQPLPESNDPQYDPNVNQAMAYGQQSNDPRSVPNISQAMAYGQQSNDPRSVSNISQAMAYGQQSNDPRSYPSTNQAIAYGRQNSDQPSYHRQSFGQSSLSNEYHTAGGHHRRQLEAAGVNPSNAAAADARRAQAGSGSNTAENDPEIEYNGTAGEKEDLDQRYRRRSDPRSFFKKGRCFMMLMADASGRPSRKKTEQEARAATAGGPTAGVPTAVPIRKYNEEFFIKARRMIVVKQEKAKGRGYSKCVPIGTYGYRGVAKPGLRVDDHAVAHMYKRPATTFADEPPMSKKAIEIMPGKDGQTLHPRSRIDFGRTHTVNWNVKVVDVGVVSEKSMKNLTPYWIDSGVSQQQRNMLQIEEDE